MVLCFLKHLFRDACTAANSTGRKLQQHLGLLLSGKDVPCSAMLSDAVLTLHTGSWVAPCCCSVAEQCPCWMLLHVDQLPPVFGRADHRLPLAPLMKMFTARDMDAAYDAQNHDASPHWL